MLKICGQTIDSLNKLFPHKSRLFTVVKPLLHWQPLKKPASVPVLALVITLFFG